jgi:hypothetical protein
MIENIQTWLTIPRQSEKVSTWFRDEDTIRLQLRVRPSARVPPAAAAAVRKSLADVTLSLKITGRCASVVENHWPLCLCL